MALGNLFKSLFGGSAKQKAVAADPIEYKGFMIVPEPISEGGQFRTAGRISKDINGETRESRFVRADNNGDYQASVDHSIYKAKQIIDEQGDRLFAREVA